MLRYGAAILVFAATVASGADISVNVPSDSDAKYYVIEKSGTTVERLVLTKRVGPSGTSYLKLLYNCTNDTFKTIADVETLEGLKHTEAPPDMGPIVKGSTPYYIGLEACKAE